DVGERGSQGWRKREEGRHSQSQTKVRGSCDHHGVPPGRAYFSVRIHSARVLASSSLTAFGGIGIGPHLPLLPFLMLAARVAAAPSTPAFLAATSFSAGPTIFMATLWQAAQGLLLNRASPSAAIA